MSKAEILEQLPKLTREEREEIRLKLAEIDSQEWLDSDDPLSDKDKTLLEARLDDLEKHPQKSIPWPEAEGRLKALRRLSYNNSQEAGAGSRGRRQKGRDCELPEPFCLPSRPLLPPAPASRSCPSF